MNHFGLPSQPFRGQSHPQHNNSENPDQPTAMQYPDPSFQNQFAGLNNPGYSCAMPVAGPSTGAMRHAFAPINVQPASQPAPAFLNPRLGYPVAPACGRPIGLHIMGQPIGNHNHIMHPPTNLHGAYTGTTAGPPPFDWTPSTNPNPPQIPTPTPSNSHQWSGGFTNPLSPNAEGVISPQSPLPTPVPLFPQPPPSRDTANTMGPLYGPPTPGRMHSQETRPDSRPNHNADSEMHEMYRDLRLQALLKDPRNHPPTALVDIRREKRVVLVLALHSNSQPISNLGWEGILLPQTRSVDPVQQISPRRLLKLSIQVHACSTGAVNVRPCDNCWSRERPPTAHNVQPYMIDFQAQSRRIALSTQMDGNENCLKADVKFHFTCYSRHHGGMYRLILKLHDESANLVAQCLLPYQFIVRANGNYTGVGDNETQPHTATQPQTPWPNFPVQSPPPAPVLDPRSPVPPMIFRPVPVNQNPQLNSNISVSILQRLAPAEGPVSGGPTILLSGINFPPPYQQVVYARFGSVAVPTTWHNPHTLECNLPPSPTQGTVGVSLSLFQEPGAPEFGQSNCSFRYKLELDYLHGLLRQISGQGNTLTPENWDAMIPHFVQNVSLTGRAMLHQATQPTQPMNPSFSTTAGEMEALTVQLLASFTNSPSWENSVSFVNEHHQTLAHLAVLFRYTTLLDKVAQWGINVDVQDVNGFTALHCAYLCGDLDSVRILKGYGADEDVQDWVGRRPSDMYIPREKGSPSSDRTSSSVQVPSAIGEDWEKLSAASSQPGSVGGHETITASGDQRRHVGESTRSSKIVPASISMPSPTYGPSSSTVEVLVGRFGESTLYESPTEVEQPLPNVPVVQLCRSSSGSCLPAESMPTRPQERDQSYSNPLSSNTTAGLSVSEVGAQLSRGHARSQGAVPGETRSGESLSTSAPIRMPVPYPFQHEVSSSQSAALFAPQTAHSSSSAASSHPINPSPGTKTALNSQPVSRPSSPGPPTEWYGPPAVPDSGLPSVRPSAYSEALPPYDEGPKKFEDDKKWPLSDKVHASMDSKGVHVKLSPEKGGQQYVAPELENLVVREGPSDQKWKPYEVHEGSPFCNLRPGTSGTRDVRP